LTQESWKTFSTTSSTINMLFLYIWALDSYHASQLLTLGRCETTPTWYGPRDASARTKKGCA
jgi:hypothetical protein